MIHQVFLQHIINEIPLACLILEPLNGGYRIVDVNKRYLAATASKREDLLGKDLFEAFPENPADDEPDGVKNIRKSLGIVTQTGHSHVMKTQKYDIPVRGTARFREKYWDPENIPIKDEDGNVRYIIYSVKDVTEKIQAKKVEKATLEDKYKAEELLLEAHQIAKMGRWEADIENNVLYWSDMIKEIHEVPINFQPEIVETINFAKEGEHREWVTQVITQAIETGRPFDVEFIIETAKGNERWVRATGTAEMKNGKPIRLHGVTQDIHQRKKAELKQNEIEGKYGALIETLHGIFWEADVVKDEFTFVSPQSKEMLGYEPEEWIGPITFWSEKIHPDERELNVNYCKRMTRLRKDHEFDYRFKTASGEYVWLRDIVTVTNHPEKGLLLRGFMIDISEQKKIEQEIDQALNNLQERIKEQSCLYKISKLGSGTLSVRRLLKEASIIIPSGFRKPEITKTRISYKNIVLQSSEPDGHQIISEKKVTPGEILTIMVWYAANMEDEFIEEEVRLLDSISDNLALHISQIENREELTKKRKLLIAHSAIAGNLLHVEDWFSALENSFNIAAKAVDADRMYYFQIEKDTKNETFVASQKFEWTNANAEPQIDNPDLQGIDMDEYIDFVSSLKEGHPFSAIIEEMPDSPTRQLLASQDIQSVILYPIYISGELFGFVGFDDCTKKRTWTEEEISFLHSIASNLSAAITRRESLLQLKRLNNNLERKTKELARSNKELEEFAFVTSHDLQEPLRMIHSFLSQLQRKYADSLDEKANMYIRFAMDGAQRMKKVILDLLHYSRLDVMEDGIQAEDMNKLMDGILQNYKRKIQNVDADIEVGPLPVVSAGKTKLEQLMSNLISNALKYRKPGEPVCIQIAAEERDNEWEFSVCDNGIGISPDYHDKIFDMFERLHHYEEFSGSGIGLAICKKVVSQIGGTIWVESSPGKGSTFYFTIPK